jgi:predicted ATP-grasp superfamily ATP-dependent carboligase
MQNKSVLVIEMSRQALAVVRSLGRAGYHIVVGRSGAPSMVEYSKYCHEVWEHPKVEDKVAFGLALTAFIDSRPDVQVIYPTGENSAVALGSMTSILSRDIELIMVHPPLLNDCLNKSQAMEMARHLEFNLPSSCEVQSNIELQAAIDKFGFPVIVKPIRSIKKIFERKAYILNSTNEFETVFAKWPSEHKLLMVQQYIAGNIAACDFVASKGRLIGYFEVLSIRTDMPDGTGFAVDFYSIPVSPDVYLACQTFVQAYRYTGAGLMQFIRSKTNNKLYFIEINPRLSAGISHPTTCGQDFPLLAMQAFSGATAAELPEFSNIDTPYNIHHRAHWLAGDIEGFLAERWRLSLPQKLEWICRLLIAFIRADSHMHWRWSDPRPSLKVYYLLLFRLTKPLRRLFKIDKDRVD